MKFYILGILFAFAEARLINTRTECITIHTTVYEKEVLKENLSSPYQLAVDHDTNTLFFSYTGIPHEPFKIAYLSLKTYEYGTVSGIHGGFANAVDGRSHIVYMGGEDGVYKFNYDTKNATKLNIAEDSNIWQMFYKDGLYFTTFPDETVYLYNQEKVETVSELKDRVMVIAVKNDGSYVYSNYSGLFTYSKTVGKATHIGHYIVNGFTADIEGNIYFSTPTGIYYINDKRNEVEELAKFDNVYGVAIEGDGNIIYATQDSIIRLKPTKKQCLDDFTVKNIVS